MSQKNHIKSYEKHMESHEHLEVSSMGTGSNGLDGLSGSRAQWPEPMTTKVGRNMIRNVCRNMTRNVGLHFSNDPN